MTYPAKQISVSIARNPNDVYDFISDPQNLPKWVNGLSNLKLEKEGEYWVTDSPMGKVKVKFCEENMFGVVDHNVVLPSGEVNYNPLRVLANADGSEVIFTLYRLPRMSDEDFARDSELVTNDLKKLKSILEKQGGGNED